MSPMSSNSTVSSIGSDSDFYDFTGFPRSPMSIISDDSEPEFVSEVFLDEPVFISSRPLTPNEVFQRAFRLACGH